MLGVRTIEIEVEGIPVKGTLQWSTQSLYQLELYAPYSGPVYTFSFPKLFPPFQEETLSEIEQNAKSHLRTLFFKCEGMKKEIPKIESALKEFWMEIQSISVLSPSEWKEKNEFLKQAMLEGYMDKAIYEKTIHDLTSVMEKKQMEREKRCESFLSQYLPEFSHLQNHFSWIRFCYEFTEKKHLLLL
ncbi:Hypothetical protein LBF_2638 [Leptospira biflexa serovar Patoc strain 'Patoc 1 (Ames)']|jgi:hypothetical protein|nr:hypothetical protein [Leptospira biflexa]ABZ95121.1 Hypothetical protein LBF_2638 [Leptospira biflexa serovar Patoc strain 'Patoc 1 (Ames)']TGM33698.1 hypothetical protein EHQ80_15750 [Leptospira biflexa]TGM35437.1 hypothetical protein EHQ89_10975 [Leptospira biflexa]